MARWGAEEARRDASSQIHRHWRKLGEQVFPREGRSGRQLGEEVRGGGRPVGHDADLYRERNTVERLINKLKAWRGIATRFDKTPESYPASVHLCASMIRSFPPDPG